MRTIFAPFIVAIAATATAQQPVAAASNLAAQLRPVEAALQEALRNNRLDAARDLLAVLTDLGYDAKAVQKLRTSLEQAKPGKPKDAADKAAAALRKSVQPLAAELPKLPADQQRKVATAILRIDGDCEAAHTALGRKRVGAQWLDETAIQCKTRAAEIEQQVVTARRLPFAVTAKPAHHPLYQAIGIDPVTEVTLGDLTVYTEWPAPKAIRAVRTAAQGNALSHWLLGEPLTYTPGKRTYLHFAQQTLYQKGIDWLLAQKRLDAAEAEAVRTVLAFDVGQERMLQDLTEAAFAVSLVHDDAYFRLPQRWLLAGHVDWIGRNAIGAALGRFTFEEGRGRTKAQSAADAERDAMARLAQAGVLGARSYLRWLVDRDQDPAWATTFLDQLGKIPPDGVIKDLFVHDFLVQRDVLKQLAKASAKPAEFPVAVEQALGVPWPEFERTWRRWFAGGDFRGAADSIAGKGERPLSADEQKALAYLNALRTKALAVQRYKEEPAPPVTFERDLADAARLHALYLHENPAQLAAWPDAHEEWPDRKGFTPQGSMAGGNSVIAGANDTIQAIDSWMGTFYHRLPLVAPGLLRTGFAVEQGTAVLDAQSMAMPSTATFLISIWPAKDATEVPLSFAPELPNPVPGADQGAWGYPVTFQHHLGTPYDPAGVTMTLHQGKESGPKVDCYYSSPVAPTNPEMSPADCYCLIPQAKLLPKTDYTVVVTMPEREALVWSFRTRAN